MDASKLLWSMIQRGWSWTTGIGALLGAAYGIVLLATAIFSLWNFNPDNSAVQQVLVLFFAVIIAALFGAFVAAAIGFVAGPVGGALCAGMSRLFFTPLKNERTYRLTARIAGGLYGILALVVAVRLISTSGLAPTIQTSREALMLYVFPALIGGAAGVYISRRVTDVYVQSITPPDAVEPRQTPASTTKLA